LQNVEFCNREAFIALFKNNIFKAYHKIHLIFTGANDLKVAVNLRSVQFQAEFV